MSSLGVNRENFLIPLEEIHRATQKFSEETHKADGGFGSVYRGQLSERWQNRIAAIKRFSPEVDPQEDLFHNELELISCFQHENIIPFIGYCDEDHNMVSVTEYATNGCLDDYLKDSKTRGVLTWAQRLRICLGVARGINYLHSGLGKDYIVIHRNINSSNILLDDDLEAKICGFSLSVSVPRNQPQVYEPDFQGTKYYIDPIYRESGMVMTKTDTYSFGVVLFEMLSGMLAYRVKSIGDVKPQLLINWVRRYYEVGLENLIDPRIRDEIDRSSLHMIKNFAYKCISFNIKDRPTFDMIVKTIEEALYIHYHGAASIVSIHSHQHLKPINFTIPLEEIKKATRNFSCVIGSGGFGSVYKGQLSEQWQNCTAAIKRSYSEREMGVFHNEVELMSNFQHENIIPFIGYCDESHEMIIVTEYATNGSLDDYLEDSKKRGVLTWTQRLKICLGVAKGLKYLHSGLGERGRVIHRDPKSGNILLDNNLEPKICDFGLSILIPRNQPQVYEPIMGTSNYMDPVYAESGFLKTEADVYTFGVLMFEILSGMVVYRERSFGDVQPQRLKNVIRRYSDDDNRVDIILDPQLRDKVDSQSLREFTDLAYECISFNLRDRPSMTRIIKRIQKLLDFHNQGAAAAITKISHQNQNLEDFLIPLEEIKTAVGGDFIMKTPAADGGYGFVYKGQLSKRWQKRTVAIKRLKRSDYQGNDEFLHELKLIFRFQHENIIPFIGYCNEENEMIIVTEYATNGSLDDYLVNIEKRTRLTWRQRLNICLGAARGLNYLHSGRGKDNRVIHRDVKSANILLDDKLEAKICDFGLSKLDMTNQTHTGTYTKYAGTDTYMDPVYKESGKLRTKSDVYSFGVVMFEMLSGTLAYRLKQYGDGKSQFLISLARRYYDVGRLDLLIDPSIRDQPYDSRSFLIFQDTAYECISMNHKQRPSMESVVDRLEEALGYQVMMESQAKVTES